MRGQSMIVAAFLAGLATTAAGQTSGVMQQQQAGNPQRALRQEAATCAMGTRLVDPGGAVDHCSEYAASCSTAGYYNYIVDQGANVDRCKKVGAYNEFALPLCGFGGTRTTRPGHDACVGGGARPTCRSGYRLVVKQGEDNCLEQ